MTDLSSLDRLLERFDASRAVMAASVKASRAGDYVPDARESADRLIEVSGELRSALVALRKQHDALAAALRTVLATMDDGKDFHTQTEALEAARALLGNAVGEAR